MSRSEQVRPRSAWTRAVLLMLFTAVAIVGCSSHSSNSSGSSTVSGQDLAKQCVSQPYDRNCYLRAAVAYSAPTVSGPNVNTIGQKTCVAQYMVSRLSDSDLQDMVRTISRGAKLSSDQAEKMRAPSGPTNPCTGASNSAPGPGEP